MKTSIVNRVVLIALIAIALAASPESAALADGPLALTILHTNDTHAHLESFTPSGEPLQGGVARRHTAIQEIRSEVDNVILVDAGDAFQGTLFFNQWQGEEASHFMNALAYDAMVVGNHEFDSGPGTLGSFIRAASFPVVSANIDASREPELSGHLRAYAILCVGRERVGVFGLTTPDTAFISSPGPNVRFEDPVEAARATVQDLEGQGINKIICLSHLGYRDDLALAEAVDGIDVIVGGHSHSRLGSMEGADGPYPTVVKSPGGNTVLVVAAYEWGRYLGRLALTFSAQGDVESFRGEPIFVGESFAEDPELAAQVARFAQPIAALKGQVVGQTRVHLEGSRQLVRTQETNLGNLICDAVLWKTAAQGSRICIQNGGGIRASIPEGEVSMGQLLEVLPFGNQIAVMGLKGSDLWAALERGVSQVEEVKGQFCQVGGMRFSFDPTKPAGSRIVNVEVKGVDGSYNRLDPDAVYRVATNDFMRRGGDGYTMFAENAIDPYDSGPLLADALAEYVQAHSPVNPTVDGRILMGAGVEAHARVAAPAPEGEVAPVAGVLIGNRGGAFHTYDLRYDAVSEVTLRLWFAPDDPIISRGFGVNIYGPGGRVATGEFVGTHGMRVAAYTADREVEYLVQVYNYLPGLPVGYSLTR